MSHGKVWYLIQCCLLSPLALSIPSLWDAFKVDFFTIISVPELWFIALGKLKPSLTLKIACSSIDVPNLS